MPLTDDLIFRFIDVPVSDLKFSLETSKKGKKYIAVKLNGSQDFAIASCPSVTFWPRLTQPDEEYKSYSLDLHFPDLSDVSSLQSRFVRWCDELQRNFIAFLRTQKELVKQLTTASTPIEYLVNDIIRRDLNENGEEYSPQLSMRTSDLPLMCNALGRPDPSVTVEKGDRVYGVFKIHPYLIPKGKAGVKLLLTAVGLFEKGNGSISMPEKINKIPAWKEKEGVESEE